MSARSRASAFLWGDTSTSAVTNSGTSCVRYSGKCPYLALKAKMPACSLVRCSRSICRWRSNSAFSPSATVFGKNFSLSSHRGGPVERAGPGILGGRRADDPSQLRALGRTRTEPQLQSTKTNGQQNQQDCEQGGLATGGLHGGSTILSDRRRGILGEKTLGSNSSLASLKPCCLRERS